MQRKSCRYGKGGRLVLSAKRLSRKKLGAPRLALAREAREAKAVLAQLIAAAPTETTTDAGGSCFVDINHLDNEVAVEQPPDPLEMTVEPDPEFAVLPYKSDDVPDSGPDPLDMSNDAVKCSETTSPSPDTSPSPVTSPASVRRVIDPVESIDVCDHPVPVMFGHISSN